MKYLTIFFVLIYFDHSLFSQNHEREAKIYMNAYSEIKKYDEYTKYLRWASSEDISVSSEILYSSEALRVCSKCEQVEEEWDGVKVKLNELKRTSKEDSKVVLFFTEIRENCFTAILKTSFNDDFTYDNGIFVGKQAYFQFSIQNDNIEICSRMVLEIH